MWKSDSRGIIDPAQPLYSKLIKLLAFNYLFYLLLECHPAPALAGVQAELPQLEFTRNTS